MKRANRQRGVGRVKKEKEKQVKLKSEGDINLSVQRKRWMEGNISGKTGRLLEEDARYFLHQSLSTPCLNVINGCKGIYLEDADGRKYMDFHGNYVHTVGYAHPKVLQAIVEQMERLSFCVRRYTNEQAIALAKKLASLAPGDLCKSLFFPGGTIAIETALKLARGYTGRFKTLSFWDSFHGATFGSISVGGEDIFRRHAGPLLPGTEHVAPPDCYRCPYGFDSLAGCGLQCARYIEYVLDKEGDFAAVISETMRSTPYIPPEGYWSTVSQACRERGVLLIFDEIPTAFGRTGKWFACEHYGVVPDILVLGKPMGGGILPFAALIAREELDVMGNYAIGHYTHEKNPVLCAAALATMQIIEEEKLLGNACNVGNYAMQVLAGMAERHRLIGNIRGKGLLIGVELVRDRVTKERADWEAEALMYKAMEKGLSFKLTMGNIVTLNPPLTITREQMERALQILEEALSEVETLKGEK